MDPAGKRNNPIIESYAEWIEGYSLLFKGSLILDTKLWVRYRRKLSEGHDEQYYW
jgi:hypothetical protein